MSEAIGEQMVNRRKFLTGGAMLGLAGVLLPQLASAGPDLAQNASVKPKSNDLAGIVDLHIHPAPDVVKRKYDDIDLALDARNHGARAVVLKAHGTTTAGRATIAHKVVPDVGVFGSITLNPSVGGINPAAVETAVKMGAKVVWLPTNFSSFERGRRGKSDGVEVVSDGQVVTKLNDVFRLVAKDNLILGTGHINLQETYIVVEAAKKAGVNKIVITHPESFLINMPLEDQKALAQYDVYFERCYSRVLPDGSWETNFERNLRAIEAVGWESTILATDGGQTQNPVWSEAWKRYLDFMHKSGLPGGAIKHMSCDVPARLLGLE